MLKQRLSQKLLQKLSPQQIQLMKLLQVPTDQLEQRIKEELEANPALEESADADQTTDDILSDSDNTESENSDSDEELDLSEYLDDDYPDYKTQGESYNPDDEEESRTPPIAISESFHESLLKQLGMLNMNERNREIAKQIIGSIDDDGYLRREISAIVDDLAFSQNIMCEEEEILDLLDDVQGFDPAGVGARDLKECLLLQLERKLHTNTVNLAIQVVEEYFDEFTKKHYEKLGKALQLENDKLKEVIDEILKCNPKPGNTGKSDSGLLNRYIVPDFTITNNNGELELKLNARNAPELHVSQDFRNMMEGYKAAGKKDKKQKEAVMFIKQKLDSAKWFIDAIRQRQQTLYNTMYHIMHHQYSFFLSGDEMNMKPMILKDIAEATGLDISTVSRVANSKFVTTEFGTYPLKFFFSESLTTDSGEEVSTREVKKLLSEMINGEDKKKPLSDQEITDQLKDKGYNIARRTVAKYREQLDIPVARLRKEL